MLQHPRQYLFFALLQVFPFALDGKTSLSVVVTISKGPADPQDIRWNRGPGTARCFRCIDFYQHLTPFIYEKYLAPKCDCFEGTVIRERMCPKSGQDLAYSHPRYSEASHGLVSGDRVKSEAAILAMAPSGGKWGVEAMLASVMPLGAKRRWRAKVSVRRGTP